MSHNPPLHMHNFEPQFSLAPVSSFAQPPDPRARGASPGEFLHSMPRSLPAPNVKCSAFGDNSSREGVSNFAPFNSMRDSMQGQASMKHSLLSNPPHLSSLSAKSKKKKPKKDDSSMEVIVCQGKLTMLPKSRSSGDRKYICNGHPIHRVTFWRHRKHGCPHEIGNEVAESPKTSQKQAPRPRKLKSEEGFSPNSMPLSHHRPAQPPGAPVSLPHPHGAMEGGSLSVKGAAFPLQGLVGEESSFDSSPYQNQPSCNYIRANDSVYHTPESGMPEFQYMPSSFRDVEHGLEGTDRTDMMMPPFSVVPDSLNLYYAPFRSAGADEEGYTGQYVGAGPRQSSPSSISARSDVSDFLDEGDMVFNSFLGSRNDVL